MEENQEDLDAVTEQLVKDVRQYRHNRVAMMSDIKKRRDDLDRLIRHGIKTPIEEGVAKIACCIIAADLFVEDAALMDKTGAMKDVLRSPDVFDDLL